MKNKAEINKTNLKLGKQPGEGSNQKLPGEVSKADFTGQGNLKPNADRLPGEVVR
jgi:hypothetical protein